MELVSIRRYSTCSSDNVSRNSRRLALLIFLPLLAVRVFFARDRSLFGSIWQARSSLAFFVSSSFCSDEERKWFQDAISANVVDVVQRMKEIALVMGLTEESLLKQGVTVDELASLLEELQEHVEAIDMANGELKRPFFLPSCSLIHEQRG